MYREKEHRSQLNMQQPQNLSEKTDSPQCRGDIGDLCSHEVFDSIAEGMAVHRLIFDAEGNAVDYEILCVNSAYENHTGIPAEQAQNKRASEVYPGNVPPFLAEYARVATTGQPESMEVYFPPFQRYFVISVSSPRKNWFISTFSDVTERKLKEAENERVNRLHAVLRHVSHAVVRTGLRNELFQQLCRIATDVGGFKMASVSVLGKTKELVRVASEGDSTGYFGKIDVRATNAPKGRGPTGTALREGRTYVCNDFAADGRTIPWREAAAEAGIAASIAVPILSCGNVCAVLTVYSSEVGYFRQKEVSALEEVADDISFALDHIEQEAELKETTRRFHTLLDEVRLVALGLDASGLVTYANPFFYEITGYSRAEVLGKKWFEEFVPKRCHPKIDTMFCELLQDDQHIHFENAICAKNGRERLIAWNNTVLRDRTGNAEGTMSIGEDITERKQMEENLLRAQRMESIGLLAGGVAHDLNNILSPIMMSASMLHGNLPLKTRLDLISNIEESAQRGANIVKQILTFARGVKGEQIVLDPEAILGELWGMVRETFPKSIIPFQDIAKGLWNITGDKTQLHQVLLNLCVNARDAMPKGGRLGLCVENVVTDDSYLTRSPEAKLGRYVCFKVSDTGMGIAPEHINRIFDPFFTTKELGNGTGLGLSTVMGIVKSHGGFVTAKSEIGEGTTFEVFIPATSKLTIADGAAAKTTPLQGNGEMLLIVDDEAEILRVTETVLARNGYLVKTATNGADALAFLARNEGKVGVIVTDLMMPNMDGPKLIRSIRKLGFKVPIIASSGYGGERSQEELTALGVQTFLKKPFNSRMLLSAIHQMIHL